jgi:hypothetical protein
VVREGVHRSKFTSLIITVLLTPPLKEGVSVDPPPPPPTCRLTRPPSPLALSKLPLADSHTGPESDNLGGFSKRLV